MMRFTAIAILGLLAALALVPGAAAQQVRTIYLVRHADKISEEPDAALSEAGYRRAECLANTLADANIEQIFTSDLQRTQKTAAPLAEWLHLKPVTIPMKMPDQLVSAIRASRASNVLVIWHGDTLPEVVRALGGPVIKAFASTEYDRFYILTLDSRAKPSRPRFSALRYCDCAP